MALDNFATFFNFTFLFAAGLTILMSDDYLKREGYPVGEYYPLILFTTAGAMWMASGTDLMTIFLGLEVLSISLYVLAGFFRGQLRSNEAGLKYFLLGAFSTGFLLYGIALHLRGDRHHQRRRHRHYCLQRPARCSAPAR